MKARFAEFTLDSATRELLRDGERAHLTPKAFDLLMALLEKRPEAVSKDRLHECLWPGMHVGDTSLAGVIAELRSALGDEPRGARFIRTIHGFGYAFSGAVTDGAAGVPPPAAASAPSCRVIVDRREIILHPGENVLGREREATACLDFPTVSRRHARIVVAGDAATIEDLGSHNGTFVNDRRVRAPTPLVDRDEIRLGSVRLIYRTLRPGRTETRSEPG